MNGRFLCNCAGGVSLSSAQLICHIELIFTLGEMDPIDIHFYATILLYTL